MALGKLFTAEDKLIISEAVKDLELHTSGEIVPVVAEASARYFVHVVFYATIFSYLSSFFLAYFLNISNLLMPVFGIVLFILFMILFKIKKIKYFLVSKKDRERTSFQLANKVFFEKNLHKTRDKTGILIFVSLFEKNVIVLGDEGINSKIDKTDWETVVDYIKAGIKSGKLIDGLKEGINSCKSLLEKFFPIKEDDTNELSNELVIIEEKDLSVF